MRFVAFHPFLLDYHRTRKLRRAQNLSIAPNQTQNAYTIDIKRFSAKVLGQYYFGTPIAFAEGGIDENKQNETLIRRTVS